MRSPGVPGFEGGTDAQPFIGVQAMYIAAKGKNKAVAQEYATNYFASLRWRRRCIDVQPRPPALKAVYDEVAASNPDIKAFVEAGANGQLLPSIPQMAAIFDPWGKALAASSVAPIRRDHDPATATAINGILGNS